MPFTQVIEFSSSFAHESDRGVILVVAAHLESCLEESIKLRLVESSNRSDELIGRSLSCPISSFGAKIMLATRLGLISPEETSVYDQLRKLRNDCAHNIDAFSFESDMFIQRIQNMVSASPGIWNAITLNVKDEDGNPKYSTVEEMMNGLGWRYVFSFYFSFIIVHKLDNYHRIPRIAPLYDPDRYDSD